MFYQIDFRNETFLGIDFLQINAVRLCVSIL